MPRILARCRRASGATAVQVEHVSASLIKLFWEAPQGVEYRSRRETFGEHLVRKAEGMVTTSTIGVISSQVLKDSGPWERFRDRTVGR